MGRGSVVGTAQPLCSLPTPVAKPYAKDYLHSREGENDGIKVLLEGPEPSMEQRAAQAGCSPRARVGSSTGLPGALCLTGFGLPWDSPCAALHPDSPADFAATEHAHNCSAVSEALSPPCRASLLKCSKCGR